MVAAVAAGAFAAAAAGQTLQTPNNSPQQRHTDVTPLANASDASASLNSGGASGVGGDAPAGSPVLLQVSHSVDASAEAQKLTESAEVTEKRLEREAEERRRAEEEAKRPKFVAPAQGVFTSGYGARWGGTHYGIDIANSIGTPIKSLMSGTVISSGPASGFGLWVRVQHDNGLVTVFGHINESLVSVGSGSIFEPFSMISKCRCGPVDWPRLPIVAIC